MKIEHNSPIHHDNHMHNQDYRSIHFVKSKNSLRIFAYVLIALFILLIILLLAVPWVQTVTGKGKVTALIPGQRPQTINSQITGRLVSWLVVEGQHVEAGDTIAILADIDSKFLDTTLIQNQQKQLDAIEQRRGSIISQISALRGQIEAETDARSSGVNASKEKVEQAKQRRIALEERLKQVILDLNVAKQRYQDRKSLFEQGLFSQRQFENAQVEQQKADVALTTLKADIEAARRQELETLENVKNKESEGTSKILKAVADESKALESVASIDNSIFKGRSDLNAFYQRKEASIVRAPIKGKIVRLFALGMGETVKQGDKLVVLVPEAQSLAVEIRISGNDAPLLNIGKKVRLQFDGFPAFQIKGWPSASAGTFGGIISVIDAVDDEQFSGSFRIVVKPDPQDVPWPNSTYLRPGTKVAGWMQLNTVSLGYELWRQFNGFPISLDVPTKKSDSKQPINEESKE